MFETAATPVADDATRKAEFVINSDFANEILAVFGVPVPDAADLDEIHIIIRDSVIHDRLAAD